MKGRHKLPGSPRRLAERFGISASSAYRLAALKLNEESMQIMVNDTMRLTALRNGLVPRRGKYLGGVSHVGRCK